MRIIELRIGVTSADELPTALRDLLAAFDVHGEDVSGLATAVAEVNAEPDASPPPPPPGVGMTPPTLAPPPGPPTPLTTSPPLVRALAPPPLKTSPPLTVQPDAATIATGAVVLDSSGLPWDARIHSGNKQFKTDGTWRGKRNLTKTAPGLLEQVTAELRAQYPVTTAAAAPPATGGTTVPPAAVPPVPGVVTGVGGTASPPQLPPPAPGAPAPAGTVTMEGVIGLASRILGAYQDQPSIEAAGVAIHSALVGIGLPEEHSTNDLIARPDLYPAAMEALQRVAAERGIA